MGTAGMEKGCSDPVKAEEFRARLMKWWSQNKREFSWRKTSDPYAVLLAEFLLQKTNAEKAEATYVKLLNRFPSPASLAQAEDQELEALFRPLGLAYRAVRVKKTAVQIAEKYAGKVPNTLEKLLDLYGVGWYMAHAVLCFAYGRAVPLIDRPTSRLLARVFGLEPAKARAREDKNFWNFAGSLVPQGMAKEYNFALLDFANKVCTPRNPKCRGCPLGLLCSFNQRDFG